ncbi:MULTISPECIES: hypothetical protein [Niastella]|uniref:Cyclophilin-like domain-containing protein n=1 Tax=Niastella soli TaxID=2821487 RepID=A0ABS3YLB5_9BACT|nr:hypothetical protein [Niastella soli]MBO9198651.1 hypothetical protein [Niastella soli]
MKKRQLLFALPLTVIVSCTNPASLPSNIRITTKNIVHDAASSINLKTCIEIPQEVNSLNSCIIKSDDKKFIREYTLLLTDKGNIASLYRYLPEGPVITSLNELQSDTQLLGIFQLSLANKITINRSLGVVIDNNDTLPITGHLKGAKMLVVKPVASKLEKGRALVYGYE